MGSEGGKSPPLGSHTKNTLTWAAAKPHSEPNPKTMGSDVTPHSGWLGYSAREAARSARGRGPGICRAWKRPHFRFDEENARLRHFRPPPPPGWPCSERSVGCAGERAVLWALPGLKGSSHRNPGTAGASAHPGDGRPGEGTAAALLGPTGVTWWQDGDPIRTRNDGPHVQAHPPGASRSSVPADSRSKVLPRGCRDGARCRVLLAVSTGAGAPEGTRGQPGGRLPAAFPPHRG